MLGQLQKNRSDEQVRNAICEKSFENDIASEVCEWSGRNLDAKVLELPTGRLQAALAMEASNWCGEAGSEDASEECMQSKRYYAEIKRACNLWSASGSGGAQLADAGAANMHSGEHLAILEALKQDVDSEDDVMPFSGKTKAQASVYQRHARQHVDGWLKDVAGRSKNKPNAGQLAVLTACAERMKIEMFEEASRCQGTSKLEPRLDVLHGPPGTGKSLVLALMKDFFRSIRVVHGYAVHIFGILEQCRCSMRWRDDSPLVRNSN